jgi:hypothetical protein
MTAPAFDNCDYKAWYEEAMVASNEAGFAGLDAAQTIRELAAQPKVLRAQRDHARASLDRAVGMLSQIGMALYPPPFDVDGKTMIFAPSDPHMYMREVSRVVRKIMDEYGAQSRRAAISAGVTR